MITLANQHEPVNDNKRILCCDRFFKKKLYFWEWTSGRKDSLVALGLVLGGEHVVDSIFLRTWSTSVSIFAACITLNIWRIPEFHKEVSNRVVWTEGLSWFSWFQLKLIHRMKPKFYEQRFSVQLEQKIDSRSSLDHYFVLWVLLIKI